MHQGLEQDLGVTRTGKPFSARFELTTDLPEIVDLAVENLARPRFWVPHRLPRVIGQIDNREAGVAEDQRVLRECDLGAAVAVGTAVAAGGKNRAHNGASPLDWPTA